MAGSGLILYAFFCYDAHTAFPGLAAIPPVVGTVLLIWSGMSNEEDVTFRGVNRAACLKGLGGDWADILLILFMALAVFCLSPLFVFTAACRSACHWLYCHCIAAQCAIVALC